MKIVSVTIENFRSITGTSNCEISQLTTLVGPNNEGKSNILRAIVLAMNVLISRRRGYVDEPFQIGRPPRNPGIILRSRRTERRYDWSADFPLNLKAKRPDGHSKVTLEFQLTAADIQDFRDKIKSNINGTLPISISLKQNGPHEITISKQGPGGKALNSKVQRIADFISEKIDIQYIPAVRTAESAQSIVNALVDKELEIIESDERYIKALEDIKNLQKPVLEDLSKKISETMKGFLPNIRQVKIDIEEQDRSYALRRISSISLNDGVETPLQAKGDGVQSLAALALMRHSSLSINADKEILIALEEPESHLHPAAIRQLRNVITELSERHQVVLTTHNPIFTNRENIKQNIIVKSSKAYPAKSIKDVRDVLGVRLDDNLMSAELILIVEGEEDKVALSSILAAMDETVRSNLRSGRLAIDVLGGASNLCHRTRLHGDAICRVHALLDDDDAGRVAYQRAANENLLSASCVNFTKVPGMLEAELEDLYHDDVFKKIVESETSLGWEETPTPDKKRKWTDRLSSLLRKAGRPHQRSDITSIKIKVARSASDFGPNAFHQMKRTPIESLLNSLTEKLKTK